MWTNKLVIVLTKQIIIISLQKQYFYCDFDFGGLFSSVGVV